MLYINRTMEDLFSVIILCRIMSSDESLSEHMADPLPHCELCATFFSLSQYSLMVYTMLMHGATIGYFLLLPVIPLCSHSRSYLSIQVSIWTFSTVAWIAGWLMLLEQPCSCCLSHSVYVFARVFLKYDGPLREKYCILVLFGMFVMELLTFINHKPEINCDILSANNEFFPTSQNTEC